MRDAEDDAPTAEDGPHYVFCTYCGDSSWPCRDLACRETWDHEAGGHARCYFCETDE